jgi:hypothetical protein
MFSSSHSGLVADLETSEMRVPPKRLLLFHVRCRVAHSIIVSTAIFIHLTGLSALPGVD